MRRNSLAGQVVSLVVSLLIMAAGVAGYMALIYKPEVEASVRTSAPDPLVYTAPLQSHTGTLDIAVDGVVVPFREIEVAAEVAGKVVFKDDACNGGRFVTRGTRLMKIDPRDYELAVRRLENQLEQEDAGLAELAVEIRNTNELIDIAEHQVELEQNEVNRLAGLIQDRVVTDSTMDRAQQTLLTARNSLVQLNNQLKLLETRKGRLESSRKLVATDLEKAKLDLQRTEIFAVVDGVVIDDLVERDSFVQKGEPLFTLEDTSAVEVKCRLKMEELYWVWRQTGQSFEGLGPDSSGYQVPPTPVKVSYRLSDRQHVHYEWDGVLSRFDGVGLDEATRTVPCRIRVDRPRDMVVVHDGTPAAQDKVVAGGPPALVRGMFVTVTLNIDQPSELLQIPERAVQPGKTVWLVENGSLQERRSLDLIELMLITRDDGTRESVWLVEAAGSGLTAGDRVVVPPFGILRDGDTVREESSR